MFIYLAHPIDLVKPFSSMRSTLITIQDALTQQLHVVFSPAHAYKMNIDKLVENRSESINKLVANNNRTLLQSDFIVFVWDGSPSWGLVYELGLATTYKKPFIFVDISNLETTPVYLANLLFTAVEVKEKEQIVIDHSDSPIAVAMKQALSQILEEMSLSFMVSYYLRLPILKEGGA